MSPCHSHHSNRSLYTPVVNHQQNGSMQKQRSQFWSPKVSLVDVSHRNREPLTVLKERMYKDANRPQIQAPG